MTSYAGEYEIVSIDDEEGFVVLTADEHLADYLEKTNAFTPEELADVYFNNAKEVYFPG